MKYLVQAILIDGDIECPIESIKTDDCHATIDWLMKRHKSSNSYRYVAMAIATQEILINTTRNIYGW